MLTLKFLSLNGPAVRLGPFPDFRFAGPSLCAGTQAAEYASYRNGLWHAFGQSFIAGEVRTPCRVHFAADDGQRSPTYGPFGFLRIVGGNIRHGDASPVVVARFDEDSQRWLDYGSDQPFR